MNQESPTVPENMILTLPRARTLILKILQECGILKKQELYELFYFSVQALNCAIHPKISFDNVLAGLAEDYPFAIKIEEGYVKDIDSWEQSADNKSKAEQMLKKVEAQIQNMASHKEEITSRIIMHILKIKRKGLRRVLQQYRNTETPELNETERIRQQVSDTLAKDPIYQTLTKGK